MTLCARRSRSCPLSQGTGLPWRRPWSRASALAPPTRASSSRRCSTWCSTRATRCPMAARSRSKPRTSCSTRPTPRTTASCPRVTTPSWRSRTPGPGWILFEPYFTTRDRGSRSGLGLATVYGVVKRSGGFVWVYSEPGLGTSVKIYLPLPRPGPTPVLPTPVPIASLRGTETILLVEDEESVRTVARHVLQRHGYAVIETARPEDALALADGTQAVDLLLTDIVMPGVGGRALAAQFTARRPGTRVLFMSGYPAAAIGRHQMLERGLAFLQKPFSAAALAEKVREVLG